MSGIRDSKKDGNKLLVYNHHIFVSLIHFGVEQYHELWLLISTSYNSKHSLAKIAFLSNVSTVFQQPSSVTDTNETAVTYIGYKCPEEGLTTNIISSSNS